MVHFGVKMAAAKAAASTVRSARCPDGCDDPAHVFSANMPAECKVHYPQELSRHGCIIHALTLLRIYIHVYNIISLPTPFHFSFFFFLKFAVEGIVKSRKRKGEEVEYLVDWEGYGEDDRTTQPFSLFSFFSVASVSSAVEGNAKSRKRKEKEAEYLVDWEGYREDDRTWVPEAAFAAFGKRRRGWGSKSKRKSSSWGGDNCGAAAAEESAVEEEEDPMDEATLLETQNAKGVSVQGCASYAVAQRRVQDARLCQERKENQPSVLHAGLQPQENMVRAVFAELQHLAHHGPRRLLHAQGGRDLLDLWFPCPTHGR